MGDQKYTVTHRIDGSGNEETQEDLVNIDKGTWLYSKLCIQNDVWKVYWNDGSWNTFGFSSKTVQLVQKTGRLVFCIVYKKNKTAFYYKS